MIKKIKISTALSPLLSLSLSSSFFYVYILFHICRKQRWEDVRLEGLLRWVALLGGKWGGEPTLGGAYVSGLMHWLAMTRRHWLVAYLAPGAMAGSDDGPG